MCLKVFVVYIKLNKSVYSLYTHKCSQKCVKMHITYTKIHIKVHKSILKSVMKERNYVNQYNPRFQELGSLESKSVLLCLIYVEIRYWADCEVTARCSAHDGTKSGNDTRQNKSYS